MDAQVGPEVTKSAKKQGTSWGKVFAIGAALAVGAKAVRFLGDSLAEAREAVVVGKRTTNVIKSMGGVANVTAKQVGDLATSISLKTGIDDEAIQSGENLLLTFGNIRNEAGKGNDIFDQTTQLMVDMSAAMGKDAKGSAIQLGKALNDPVKGVTALTRVGVAFTEGQVDQIKKLQESGQKLKAQKIILREVKKEFGGAAEAMASPADKARVAFDNLKEQIGTALLPQVDRLLTFFTDTVVPGLSTGAKKIKRFFKGIAEPVKDFFDSAAGHSLVAGSLVIMGQGAEAIRTGLRGAAGFAKKIGSALGEVDFGNLDSKQIGEALGEAVVVGLDKLASLTGTVGKKIGAMFAKVDWVGIGIEIGKQVPALLVGLAAGFLTFDMGSLFKEMADHWLVILGAVLIIAFAPAKFVGVIGRVLAKIPFVGTFLARAVIWLNELGGRLLKFGGEIMKAFFRGLGGGKVPGSTIVKVVMSAFKGIPGAIKGFFDLLRIRLGVYALEGASAFGVGIRAGMTLVLKFVASIPGKILSGLGNLAKLLFPKGSAAVESLLTGLKAKVPEIIGWVKALPGRLVTAVGNVANLLYSKGADLIAGFARGMLDKLDDAYNAAKKIVGKIAGLFPGSPVKEGPLTAFNGGKNGKALMTMFAKGIKDGGKEPVAEAENWTDILVDRIKKKLEKAKDAFKAVKDEARSLRESVASAFSTDLFSSESLADFLTGGFADIANLTAVADAIKKLRAQGVNSDFLAALGQSGNSALTLQLAADPAGLAQAQAIFLQQQQLSNEIGASVADAKFGEAIDKLGGKVEHLEQKILDLLPGRIGHAVGEALDGVAAGAKHNARPRHLAVA